jgi:trimeric autotransporter adhesin
MIGTLNLSGSNIIFPSGVAKNGITLSGNTFELWGTLIHDTTIQQSGSTIAFMWGNIGIGTLSPNAKLDVQGSVYVGNGWTFYNPDGWDKVIDVFGWNSRIASRTNTIITNLFSNDAGFWGSLPGGGVGTSSNHAFSIISSGSVRMTFTSTGGIGIGTTAPDANLDIVGTLRFDDGKQGTWNILISDDYGNASWQIPQYALGWSFWGLYGNDETIAGTHFIGTVDDQDLVFRTNNTEKMRISQTGRLEFSNTSGDATNMFVGLDTGNESLTGASNIGFWVYTLTSLTNGSMNTAVGGKALYFTTSGSYNTALGNQAMYQNRNGNSNTAIGQNALYANVSGSYNTAVGEEAGFSLEVGSYNTAIGKNALRNTTFGSYNTALGLQSLYQNSTGSYNTAIGKDALVSNTAWSFNIALGNQAGYDYNDTTGAVWSGGNIFIGYNTARGLVTWWRNTIIGSSIIGLDPDLSDNIILADGQGRRRINVNQNGDISLFSADPGTLGNLQILQAASGDIRNRIVYGNDGSTSKFALGMNQWGSIIDQMVLDSNGNLGIGTAAPSAKLDVQWSMYVGNGWTLANADGWDRVLDVFGYHSRIATRTNNVTTNLFSNDSWFWGALGGGGVGTTTNHPFSIVSNANVRMAFLANGNIWVGTNTPTEAFEINGTTRINSSLKIMPAWSGNDALRIQPGDDLNPTYNLITVGNSTWTAYPFRVTKRWDILNSGVLTVSGTGASSFVGDLGIGTTTPSYKLHVNGTAAGTSWTNTSDSRFKTNIVSLSGGLDIIQQLTPVSYIWNALGKEHGGDSTALQYGFIAQDVETILPDIVHTDNEWYKSIDYIKVVPFLTKSIQELNEKKVDSGNFVALSGSLATQSLALSQIQSTLSGMTASGVNSSAFGISSEDQTILDHMVGTLDTVLIHAKTTFTEMVTFVEKVVFSAETVFEKSITVAEGDTAGTAIIQAGEKNVHISFHHPYTIIPKIVTTADTFTPYRIINKTEAWFTIETAVPVDTHVAFDWIALSTKWWVGASATTQNPASQTSSWTVENPVQSGSWIESSPSSWTSLVEEVPVGETSSGTIQMTTEVITIENETGSGETLSGSTLSGSIQE